MKNKVTTIILIAIFSMILWGSVTLSSEYFATVNVPIVYLNLPENTAIARVSDENLMIKFKGQGWSLASLTFGRDLEYNLSVKPKIGQQTLSFQNSIEDNSWLPSNVTIEEFIPNNIEISLEPIASKSVPIIPDVILNFKPGYGLVSKIKIEPDSVIITGPQSTIKKISNVKTSLFESDGIEQNVTQNIGLSPIDNVVYSFNNSIITLDIQKIVDKTFDNITVETKNVPSDQELILFPPKVRVILRGGIIHLGRLSPNDVQAIINYKDALIDTAGSLEPKIIVPLNTSVIDIKPRKLEYIIKKF